MTAEPKPIPVRESDRPWVDWIYDQLPHPIRTALEAYDDAHLVGDVPEEEECDCPPCPGKGLDGNGMNHCAECCWGSRVIADIDCPIHGKAAYS